MFIINLGQHGITSNGVFFEPGKNVEVDDELGEYLLKKYSNSKLALHFNRGVNAIEHLEAAKINQLPNVPKKRGRKPKVK